MINHLGSDKLTCVFSKCQLLKLPFLLSAKNACLSKNDLIILVFGSWNEISRGLSLSDDSKLVDLNQVGIVLCSYIEHWDLKVITYPRGTGGRDVSASRLYKGRSGEIYS